MPLPIICARVKMDGKEERVIWEIVIAIGTHVKTVALVKTWAPHTCACVLQTGKEQRVI